MSETITAATTGHRRMSILLRPVVMGGTVLEIGVAVLDAVDGAGVVEAVARLVAGSPIQATSSRQLNFMKWIEVLIVCIAN